MGKGQIDARIGALSYGKGGFAADSYEDHGRWSNKSEGRDVLVNWPEVNKWALQIFLYDGVICMLWLTLIRDFGYQYILQVIVARSE